MLQKEEKQEEAGEDKQTASTDEVVVVGQLGICKI